MALGEPGCVGDAAIALFDPAMTGIRLDLARAPLRASGIGEEKRCVLMQARLIALEGEQVIRALVDDAPGDLFLPFCVPSINSAQVGLRTVEDKLDVVPAQLDDLAMLVQTLPHRLQVAADLVMGE